jgi:hypothetical protein
VPRRVLLIAAVIAASSWIGLAAPVPAHAQSQFPTPPCGVVATCSITYYYDPGHTVWAGSVTLNCNDVTVTRGDTDTPYATASNRACP